MDDRNHLGDIQVLLLKAMKKRKRAAPFCNSFLFTTDLIVRSEILMDLVERGFMMRDDNIKFGDVDMYCLTSDGKVMAEKLR